MIVVIASTVAIADTGMRTVIELVEARYAVRHHGIPGLWLAKPLLIGSGVGRLKIAEFTSFHMPPQDSYSLKQELRRSLGPEWHSFVQEQTKGDGRWSVIYAKANDKGLGMLIIESEPGGDFTVVQMNLSGDALHRWLAQPLQNAEHKISHHE
jgi:hypothetical protein